MKRKITLAEIEAYLRKDAQAIDLDWGIAEEAGKAARWLAAFNLPGPELVFRHLSALRRQQYDQYIPDSTLSPWLAPGGTMCPIIAGAALADRSCEMLGGRKFYLGGTAFPLLLAATVGQAARCHHSVFITRWADVQIHCFEEGMTIEGNANDLQLERVESVECRQGNLESAPRQLPSTLAYSVDTITQSAIEALAFETYAPATEASRAGAGAGLTDND